MVVAAGRSERFGRPKQWEELAGRPMIAWSLTAARSVADGVVLVVPKVEVVAKGDVVAERHSAEQRLKSLTRDLDDWPAVPTQLLNRAPAMTGDAVPDATVAGGATRSASVRAGLAAVPDDAAIVVVHDAARPLATPALFESVVAAVREGAAGAVPGVPVSDTMKRVSGSRVVETVDRDALVAVQTPQAFAAEVLRRAHETTGDATDDACLVEALGLEVVVVPGDPHNLKVTYPLDLEVAERIVSRQAGRSSYTGGPPPPTRPRR